MALTTSDLEAIDNIVAKRIDPLEKRVIKMDRKIDKFFNFLDKDIYKMKQKISAKLGINIFELSTPGN